MAEQLKSHSGDTLYYDNYQELLKPAPQHHDQKTRANLLRATHKACTHDVESELTEVSNLLEETCYIDFLSPDNLARIMRRRGNSRKCNGNSNKNVPFDKHHMIPKKSCAPQNPESKEFWNSMCAKEKAST